jgi:hypothetical protein
LPSENLNLLRNGKVPDIFCNLHFWSPTQLPVHRTRGVAPRLLPLPGDVIIPVLQLNIFNQTAKLTPSLDVLLVQVSSEGNPPPFLRVSLG